MVEQESHGELSEETLHGLDSILVSEKNPVILAMHQPPIDIQIAYFDGFKLLNADALAKVLSAKVLSRNNNVIGILCGHTHSNTTALFCGVLVSIVSGLSSSLSYSWVKDDGDMLTDRPISIAFHLIHDGKITTHYATDDISYGG